MAQVYLIERSTPYGRWNKEEIVSEVIFDHGWFPTKEAAQEKITELVGADRARHAKYLLEVDKANEALDRSYRRDLENYQILKDAGRRVAMPPKPIKNIPQGWDAWAWYNATSYGVIEVDQARPVQ